MENELTPLSQAASQLITGEQSQSPMFLTDQFEAYLNLSDAEIGGRQQRCVDARELHEKLGVGKVFTEWVKTRITQEELVEGADYLHSQTGVQLPSGTKYKSVYTLTLESAKIIAAMERNDAGRRIRKWLDAIIMQQAVDAALAQAATTAVTVTQPRPAHTKPQFLTDQFEAYLKLFNADIGGRQQRCVDAEELHEKLGVGKTFTEWVKTRISQEQFEEGADFTHSRLGVRGIRGATEKSVYTLTLESAKIIAAMERNDAGRRIRKWLVRVEDEVSQQASQLAIPQSRIELLEMALAAERRAEEERQRADVAMEQALGMKRKIDSSVLLQKVAPEPGKVHISIKDIKAEFAPYLAEPKIRLVLRFYGQGRTRFQFGTHENANFPTFQRAGLDEVFDRFREDASMRISSSKNSVIIDHECFDGETSRVPKDVAIARLGYAAEQFEN